MMHSKSIIAVALAATCCLSVGARSKKKQKLAPAPKEVAVKPVPADSFSYAIGVAQGESLRQFLVQREGVDSNYMDEAIRGIKADLSDVDLKKALAYAAGLRIQQMNKQQLLPSINQQATGKQDTTYLQLDQLNKGLTEVLSHTKTSLTAEEAVKLLERQTAYLNQQIKAANAAYLAANAKNKDVVTDKRTGLQYKVIKKGTGALPTDTSEVEVNYEGKLIDGTVFDSSYKRGKAASFRLDQVIKGWQMALKMMPVGSTYEVYIPYELGYGERGTRGIPPYSTLIFKVELLGIKSPEAEQKGAAKTPAAKIQTPATAVKTQK